DVRPARGASVFAAGLADPVDHPGAGVRLREVRRALRLDGGRNAAPAPPHGRTPLGARVDRVPAVLARRRGASDRRRLERRRTAPSRVVPQSLRPAREPVDRRARSRPGLSRARRRAHRGRARDGLERADPGPSLLRALSRTDFTANPARPPRRGERAGGIRRDRRRAMTDARTTLGSFVRHRRERICERWIARVEAEHDPNVTPTELRDHMPDFLCALAEALDPGETPETRLDATGQEHGNRRFRSGFDLRQVVAEYGLLVDVILDCATGEGVEPTVAEFSE